jgi:hypothetical protein
LAIIVAGLVSVSMPVRTDAYDGCVACCVVTGTHPCGSGSSSDPCNCEGPTKLDCFEGKHYWGKKDFWYCSSGNQITCADIPTLSVPSSGNGSWAVSMQVVCCTTKVCQASSPNGDGPCDTDCPGASTWNCVFGSPTQSFDNIVVIEGDECNPD